VAEATFLFIMDSQFLTTPFGGVQPQQGSGERATSPVAFWLLFGETKSDKYFTSKKVTEIEKRLSNLQLASEKPIEKQ